MFSQRNNPGSLSKCCFKREDEDNIENDGGDCSCYLKEVMILITYYGMVFFLYYNAVD